MTDDSDRAQAREAELLADALSDHARRARKGLVVGLGIWWRKDGDNGTNVNELTHQQLTDIGRAPSFYDCLVDVGHASAPAP